MPGSDMILSKQVNSVDCGVYLLEYIERFCKAPFVDTTTRESLGKYFFTPQYIIEKRNKILDLIFKLKREE
ncbi:hypothetical protein MHBO_002344 [Bonamia ostreae]|uniref:Ubiquitin-like protease family profile domain-containing protein n=1 Tax=Bonamia ostreae TaxID=126728 RepID=A0ABV2AM01_9EUKA